MNESRLISSDTYLTETLARYGLAECKSCGRVFDRGDVAWSNGQTEAGTPHATLEIICTACSTEALCIWAWAEIESLDDFVDVLDTELPR